ncbi:hypothetical protein RGQ29_000076 [Quercus rubra]|uniref:Uncharacterized protein n=1 Tax=Quercus rubra TaxID=3512 RepID=A0AAN7GDN8_QUERU|nr:hypothetical protein RGQ29_000076 [Quercus rubra]
MKNVAKCDTWCELQNPANHRVFERKLRPKPFGRGHVCLGVTHRCPPQTPPKSESSATSATTIGGFLALVPRRARPVARTRSSTFTRRRIDGASNATPGQAGLPAEFKHINKRRKRNLQGFP